jgi:hypothetical protein
VLEILVTPWPRSLRAAGATTGVRHNVALPVVFTERIFCFEGKSAREEVELASRRNPLSSGSRLRGHVHLGGRNSTLKFSLGITAVAVFAATIFGG